MPPLQLLPMLQRILVVQEENFWWGWDLEMGEELELGPPPPTIQLEEAGWLIPWGLVVKPAKESPPLPPLGPGAMEVDGAEQVLEDGATVGEAVDEETDSSLQPS